ncbi:MAG: transcriptional repressor [Geobacteraceae bacterium]|nr:transcriptional repressor [Geobacteraceae bacterium]
MKNDLQRSYDLKRKELETVCRSNGLALTIQRRAIFDALASRTDHPTVDQVYEDISEKLKGVSRTTVYRVLETFVSIGVATKISNPESKARFDADTKRHHHLTCIACGKVLDLHDPTLDNLVPREGKIPDFDILDYSITFTGICSGCRKKPLNKH